MKGEFTAIYQRDGDWYLGTVAEIPGVNTQGRSLREVRENLREALEMVLDAQRHLTEQGLAGREFTREAISVDLAA